MLVDLDRAALIYERYPNVRDVVWCQEEPQNQGAWYQIRHRLDALSHKEVLYAGRAPASAPATGLAKIHETEQIRLIEAALHASAHEESGSTPPSPPRVAALGTTRKSSNDRK